MKWNTLKKLKALNKSESGEDFPRLIPGPYPGETLGKTPNGRP